jgi:hypothetical protein
VSQEPQSDRSIPSNVTAAGDESCSKYNHQVELFDINQKEDRVVSNKLDFLKLEPNIHSTKWLGNITWPENYTNKTGNIIRIVGST